MLNTNQFMHRALKGCAVLAWIAGWPALAATNTVHFGYPYFSPSDVTIHPGDTVLWVHDLSPPDITTHNVSVCGPAPVPISVSRTFTNAGTFAYQCSTLGHADLGMTGVVRVVSLTVPPAVLTNATRLSNGNFQFTVRTTANQTNVIQATTNLPAGQNWVPLATIVPTNNTYTFTDSNASPFQIRFYRVLEP